MPPVAILREGEVLPAFFVSRAPRLGVIPSGLP